ncbi:MAG: transposase [archaeon]
MNFKQGIDPNQEFLFPKKPSEFLPENHLAKAIYEIIKLLDLRKIEAKYSAIGQNAYAPRMMTSILFYGYSISVRSSRKISKGCGERFDFVYLAEGLKPSHDRISDFRKDNLEELKEAFQAIVLIGIYMGLAKFGNIKTSIDGSKVRANASAKLSKDEEGLKKLLEKTKEEINKMFEEAEQIDEKEDEKYGKENRGDELPKNLQSKKSREKAIRGAIKKLKKHKEEMKDKIREEKNRELTKSELKKIEKMKINVTDNDAKFMKERNGLIKPNYNAQISVDEKEQFILANDVVDECNDQHQLVPMLKQTKENIGEIPKKAKADNGYYPQLEEAAKLFPEIDLYVDDKNRRKEDLDLKSIQEEYNEIEYKNLRKLLTKKGNKEYKKRMHTVEPPFGNIKFNLGFRYFLLRGLDKVKGEFNLMCIAHNLKKIMNFIRKKGIALAEALSNIKENIKEITKIKRSSELRLAC